MRLSKTLQDEKVSLKTLTTLDISTEYINWLNDPTINQYLQLRHKTHQYQDVYDFVNACYQSHNNLLLSINDCHLNKHIGNIKLGPCDFISKESGISLFIGNKDYWKKGYATRAINLLSYYGFFEIKLDKIVASAYSENLASLRAFFKAGFKEDKVFVKSKILRGKKSDVIQVACYKKDFLVKLD